MDRGVVQIYFGEGRGKSMAAIGSAIEAASQGRQVVLIQFLKGKNEAGTAYLSRLEPEIKFFRFAKSNASFAELSPEAKKEETMNLRNGFNYGRKVASTGGCDLLVLDEVLGAVDENVISAEEMRDLFANKSEDVTIICTGRVLHDEIRPYADEIYNIAPEK